MLAERFKKLKERIKLSYKIKRHSIEMSPCFYYERNGWKCLVAENFCRCSKCACCSQKCDVKGIPASDWAALEREEERFEVKEQVMTAKLFCL